MILSRSIRSAAQKGRYRCNSDGPESKKRFAASLIGKSRNLGEGKSPACSNSPGSPWIRRAMLRRRSASAGWNFSLTVVTHQNPDGLVIKACKGAQSGGIDASCRSATLNKGDIGLSCLQKMDVLD